jgi:deoxyribonuclease V
VSTDWPITEEALVAVQRQLAAELPEPWRAPAGARSVGGCFVCFERGRIGPGAAGDRGWAAATVLVDHDGAGVAVVAGRASAPYVPGLLAMRDGPLLEAAVRRLPASSDVLLVNATGRDHPRRAGLALHLGARLELPTIGVTSATLIARGDWPAEGPGAVSLLHIGDEVVGCWLRVRRGVRPLAIHPGWRTDVDTAVAVVMAATRGALTPEPLRQARRAAREARAGDASGPPIDDPSA